MNVALILTGHLRCWEQVFPNTKEVILDRFQPDVFIHAWDDEAWWDPHSKEGFVADTPKIDMDKIKKAYNPVEYVSENFEDYRADFDKQAEQYENHYHVKRNILSMFYKAGRGINMMNQYTAKTGKHYDFVIRMRPDLVFKQHLPEFTNGKFYTIQHKNHLGQGTGDMFQASNQWLMSMFGNLSIILPVLYNNTKVLCPHIISENMFRSLNMPWEEFPIERMLMHTPAGEYKPKESYKDKSKMDEQDYLQMQKNYYNWEASRWTLEYKDPVVGWYHQHEAFTDYDNYLFKDFETKGKIALEYGCGPGRNLIRFAKRFDRVDGVDISPVNLEKAKINMDDAKVQIPNLYVNSGCDIPVDDETYDVVFSVICLQHICVHETRYKIMQEIYRVLKPGGYFCAQMGFGGREASVNYYDNNYGATGTNGWCDISIENEDFLKDDLSKIGFKNYKSDFRDPCHDLHKQWIWFQIQK